MYEETAFHIFNCSFNEPSYLASIYIFVKYTLQKLGSA